MKLMFVINSFDGGGAEKVMSTLANETFRRRKDIDLELVTLDDTEDKYAIDPGLKRTRLDSDYGLVRSLRNFYRFLKGDRPDMVLAFLTRANLVAAPVCRLLGTKVVISERVNTSSHFATRRGALFYKILIRLIYPMAEKIVCVSSGVKRDLIENFGIKPEKLVVINNPFDFDLLRKRASEEPSVGVPDAFIVAAGRLMPNKNVAGLITSYAASKCPFDLVILGEGPERAALERLIAEKGLGARVHLAGHVLNPYPFMARAKAFVSASMAEGFPNALVEAMVLDNPVISTDCDSGPSEILAEDADLKVKGCVKAPHGILVPVQDNAAMTEALDLLADEDLRTHYRQAALARSSHYSLERALIAYLETLGAPAPRF